VTLLFKRCEPSLQQFNFCTLFLKHPVLDFFSDEP